MRAKPLGTVALRYVLVVVIVVLGVGCASGENEESPHGLDGTGADAGAREGPVDQESIPALQGVAVEVLSAVAPYDAASAADGRIVSSNVSRLAAGEIVACLNRHGISESLPEAPTFDRDALMRSSNAAFPYIDGLAREGIAVEIAESGAEPATGGDEPPPGGEEALASCMDESDVVFALGMQDSFWSVRGAWEDVLGEIDATDEIVALARDFSRCLQDEGIPARAASDEWAFLGHIDGLMLGVSDREEMADIGRQYGQLYAECGRELFEARERLRGGERRVEFLAEHADAILELDAFLYGDGDRE